MPLLHSKLLIPDSPTPFVPRQRLLDAFDGLATPVTVVCAPAGWGKTALLSSWARTAGAHHAIAWLSIEAEDSGDDFWSYLGAVLAESADGEAAASGTAASGTAASGTAPSGSVASDTAPLGLICEALTRRAQPLALVLDDLHHLDDADLLRGLDFVLRHAAGRLRVVVATRSEPGLALHRWRLRGELTELGMAELSFTPAETAQVLAEHGVRVCDDVVHAVHDYTEGWPGGVQLAALQLARTEPSSVVTGPGETPAPGGTASWAYPPAGGCAAYPATPDLRMAEYLFAEVVAEQPERVRGSLVDMSVVDRVCGGLVDALAWPGEGAAADDRHLAAAGQTPAGYGADVLARLCHTNAFVIPLPGQPGWYRLHHAFRDVLRAELARQGPERIRTLHRRAARWLQANEHAIEALGHAIAARAWNLATDVFAAGWQQFALSTPDRSELTYPGGTGRADEVDRAAARGAAAADGTGDLALSCAAHWLLRLDLAEADAHLRLADRNQEEPPSSERAVRVATCRLLRAHLVANPGAACEAAAELLAVAISAPMASAVDDGEIDERAVVTARAALGSAELNRGEYDAAQASLREAAAAARRTAQPDPYYASLARLALLEAVRGELRAARAAAGAVLTAPTVLATTAAARCHTAPEPADYARLALALAAIDQLRLDEAEAHLALVADAREPAFLGWLAIARARLHLERGDLAAGLAALGAGGVGGGVHEGVDGGVHEGVDGETLPGQLRDWLVATEAEIRIAHGDTRMVRRTLAAQVDGARTGGSERRGGCQRRRGCDARAVALADACLRDDDPVAAIRALPAWETDAGAPLGLRLQAGLIEALAAHGGEDPRRALGHLEHVLRLAEPEGFRRVFARHGVRVRRLLQEHLDSGTAYWPTVHELIKETWDGSAPELTSPVGFPLAEPLTDRELTILRYLQSILSNVEIAGELRVSVNTVKTHVRNIYRKLDAPRRREAVRRARELHLL